MKTSVTHVGEAIEKTVAESATRGLAYEAFGKSFRSGFMSQVLPGAASEMYHAFLPWDSQMFGKTGAAGEKDGDTIVYEYF